MRRGHTGDAAVITEPTTGRILTASAGALTFTITVPGRAAHGSMRLEGVNALDAFLPVYRRLRDLETEGAVTPEPASPDYGAFLPPLFRRPRVQVGVTVGGGC